MQTVSHRTYKSALLGLIAATCLSSPAFAGVAKVEFAVGDATVSNADHVVRPITKGMQIEESDLINTQTGRVQLRFTDGAYMALAPRTQFKVDSYTFNGKNDGEEKGFFSLIKGSFRTISGLIGKGKRSAYQVTTPTATIGIRGTEYTATEEEGLTVSVTKGAVAVTNETGEHLVNTGENIYLRNRTSKPSAVENNALPDNGMPEDPLKDKVEPEYQNNTCNVVVNHPC